ncbi:MAG: hypothetical protein LH618_19725 [Saprospiraceae bacterium]|nr:hypothetical protein [Saprospiraceae bacterium]
MLTGAKRFQEALAKRGYPADKLQLNLAIDPHGQHNEDRWGREFPKAVEWLF